MGIINLKELPTFVYIDASNIKNALKVSNINIDWQKLYKYFSKTYANLKQIQYFEGADNNDNLKHKEFSQLEKFGYITKTLSRKSYINPAKYKIFKCNFCKKVNNINIIKKSVSLKSNIDVYLCTQVITDVFTFGKPVHIIVLSCDGDYAEMINKILELKKDAYISVFATPFTKTNNYLSVRLKELERKDRYYLVNILNIKDLISSKNKNESHTEVGLSNGH